MALAHGSDGALAYQDLTPDDVVSAVETAMQPLGLRCDGRLLALNSYENRVYRVGVEDSAPVVAKFYRPGRWTDAAILEEHAFTAELAAQEVPVAAPLAAARTTLFRHGSFRLAIYPCFGGRAPELDDRELLRQLGRFVARIHLCGARSDFVHRPRLSIESHGTTPVRYLQKSGFIPDDLTAAYESVCATVLERVERCFDIAGPIQSLRLHGDFHPGNVLVREDVLHIVDLDDTCMGPAVQDLWMFLAGTRTEQAGQLAELLGGYLEFRDFDPAELHLVEALRALRQMHYAAWLARRWNDPAFKLAFPWFGGPRYWDQHILSLREQIASMDDDPLPMP